VDERAARTSLADLDHLGNRGHVRLTPRLTLGHEEIALGPGALTDVDAEPLVPGDVDFLAGVAVDG
jgi:hypothetical protein